ncbi:hypothetical protein L2D08_20300 [Domibacillus sp. PGB-M46]|uniref:hypothetical protein n=1 Tax=Domibacillus sp. PGB-M46 TaxID=2910255 RepID=UPI001F569F60|nr:hypothetical protein [Domibacillus sp. PGB-M46]MCI2256677.1 hypothetical protein [Domibacillus sp. PGB-M46]
MIDSTVLTIIAVFAYGIFYFLWTSRNKEAARKRNEEIKKEFKGEGKYGILAVFLLFGPALLFIAILWLIIE